MLQLQMLGIVGVAGFVGALLGIEREFADKPAGLRTHMFVAAGAALLMLMAEEVVNQFQEGQPAAWLNADPIRVIQAIVIGINFLGAGTILHQSGNRVEGLTTAASIFFTACLGITVALNQFVVAFGASLAAVILLRSAGWIERRIANRRAAT